MHLEAVGNCRFCFTSWECSLLILRTNGKTHKTKKNILRILPKAKVYHCHYPINSSPPFGCYNILTWYAIFRVCFMKTPTRFPASMMGYPKRFQSIPIINGSLWSPIYWVVKHSKTPYFLKNHDSTEVLNIFKHCSFVSSTTSAKVGRSLCAQWRAFSSLRIEPLTAGYIGSAGWFQMFQPHQWDVWSRTSELPIRYYTISCVKMHGYIALRECKCPSNYTWSTLWYILYRVIYVYTPYNLHMSIHKLMEWWTDW